MVKVHKTFRWNGDCRILYWSHPPSLSLCESLSLCLSFYLHLHIHTYDSSKEKQCLRIYLLLTPKGPYLIDCLVSVSPPVCLPGHLCLAHWQSFGATFINVHRAVLEDLFIYLLPPHPPFCKWHNNALSFMRLQFECEYVSVCLSMCVSIYDQSIFQSSNLSNYFCIVP